MRHHQRARDRRRRHDQHVGAPCALARQREALVHAEAMLLVDDGKAEILERDVLLEQRVRADQRCRSRRPPGRSSSLGARAALLAAGEQRQRAGRRLSASGAMVSTCWRASTSVGAIRAACRAGLHRARPWPAAPPPSCRSRRRPAAAAACAAGAPCPSAISSRPGLRAGQREGSAATILARTLPSPAMPRPGGLAMWARTSASASWPASSSS